MGASTKASGGGIVFTKELAGGAAARRVLKASIAERDAWHGAQVALEAASAADWRRRARVGRRALSKILDAGADALGFPRDHLDRLHDADFDAARRASTAAVAKARATLLARLKAKRRRLHETIRAGHFEHTAGNPVTMFCLNRPSAGSTRVWDGIGTSNSSIHYSPTWQFRDLFSGTGQNPRASVLVSLNAARDDNARVDTICRIHYQAVIGRDGIFTPMAHFSANGTYSLTARGDCFNPGDAWFSIRVRLEVELTRGRRVHLMPVPFFSPPLASVGLRPDCRADRAEGIVGVDVDAGEVTHPAFAVRAGDVVGIAGSYLVRCFLRNGASALLDFASTPDAGFAVPAAAGVLDS